MIFCGFEYGSIDMWLHLSHKFLFLFLYRSLLAPKYSLLDAQGQVALTIEGPICTYSICGDVEFQVLSPDGSTEVGKIRYGFTWNINNKNFLSAIMFLSVSNLEPQN